MLWDPLALFACAEDSSRDQLRLPRQGGDGYFYRCHYVHVYVLKYMAHISFNRSVLVQVGKKKKRSYRSLSISCEVVHRYLLVAADPLHQ